MHKNLVRLSVLFVLSALFFAAKNGRPADKHEPYRTSSAKRPNILFVISDDQSYPHTSAYGYEGVSTPAFDRVAREGVLFTNAFSASPGCSPSRAAILTGKNCWQLEHAGTHASSFSAQFQTYPDLLEASGYLIGHTGKGWGPGNFKISGRSRNPAGPAFNKVTMEAPKGISNNDYAANFKSFLSSKPQDKPFCFWFGAQEPHRRYPTGIGKRSGMDMSKVKVPGFLPESDEVKSDMMDYLYEIQWFDNHLARIIRTLEETGELDNTIIVVTSDNGMPFPRAKANVYEYGIHLPLAIRWGSKVKGNRKVTDPVSLTDLAPTFLEAAGVPFDAKAIAGKSLMNILTGSGQGEVDKSREAVFASRERHSSSRWNNLGYPQRCIRTRQYLYIWNVYPARWPAGDPQEISKNGQLAGMDSAYFDIDDFTESYVFSNRKKPGVAPFFHMAVDKRPGQELYDIVKDPACLHNLAAQANMKTVVADLDKKLKSYLTATGDPRMGKNGEIFETYERYSPLRAFPSRR
ncbi:sulfatase family protein [Dyadobacter fermentans]|uniref:Sulfatase n=1 Tax=Dyadobacter fermentans (strain ATCC 700827 / DSM 18053 / CIP 107007 / KCTC 52180 / NS114) TaxID=471854 RepID=C6W285_DYAFD|nr:sulfatase [Dyadobacter fermentans]ACT92058.1 sulfatase [Dyadobacter fermentans DSM 18053]